MRRPVRILEVLILSLAVLAPVAQAAENDAAVREETKINLPLVFDPASKKYFIGGSAKFILKPGTDSSLIDSIEVAVDGGDFQPYERDITFKDEGKHTLKFRAKNPVNNWSPVQFTEVFVDMTAPLTEAKWNDKTAYDKGKTLYLQLNSKLTLVAQDNLSGVGRTEYSWDGEKFVPFLEPIVVEKSGPQTLYYRSLDKVGNTESTKKLDFIADGTPPASQMKLLGAGKPITHEGKPFLGASDASGFELSADDDASEVKQIMVSIDGAAYQPYLKAIYFLKDGPHALRYYSEDNVGNREQPKLVSAYIVSQAPRTSATAIGKLVNTGGMNFGARDFQLKLEAKDNVIGLDRIELKLDDEKDFRPYVEPIRFTRQGYQQVSYRSVDRAGNVEPTRIFAINIHTTPPETNLTTSIPLVLREGLSYSPSPNVLSLNVSNSTVGVESTVVSLDDGPMTAYKGPITLLSDKKVHKLTYRSTDKLGNEEATKTATFHMISSTPVVDLFVSDGTSAEEKVRTNLFDQTPTFVNTKSREVASPPPAIKKAAPAKKSPPRKKR